MPQLANRRRFPTHAFIVLTLQKLVHLYDSDSEHSDSDNDTRSHRSQASKRSASLPKKLLKRLKRKFHSVTENEKDGGRAGTKTSSPEPPVYLKSQSTGFSDVVGPGQLRTLQRYHVSSPNDPRAQFMEKNSALSSRNLAVACEQVSLFLTNDNSIISFFEQSAEDIELPVIRRLQTNDTIIRQ
jgi:hypothetical protein